MEKRGTSEWHWKAWAISQCITEIELVFRNSKEARTATIVPIPSSKCKTDPLYDDRMIQIAERARCFNDVRELLIQPSSRKAAHEGTRLRPSQIEEIWELDESKSAPAPSKIIILDDILTHGAQFRTADKILRKRFPEAEIRGLVIARCEPDDC